MKEVIWAALLGLVLSLSQGCGVSQYTANTTASANKDGFNYTSNKNQESLHATGEIDPGTGNMKFDVTTTATTPEAAIAAAMQTNLKIQEQISAILQSLLPLIQAAAKAAAASKGIPLP